MDIGDVAVLRLVDEGRSADVVPHLPARHGEDEEERHAAPRRLVVEELEVVPAQVEEAADEGEEHEERDGARVVGRPEHPDVHLGPLADPLGHRLRAETHPLDVHRVQLLGLPLGREVHEDGRRVQLHGLEDVGALVEVDHGEEHLVGVELRVAVRVGDELVLCSGLLTDGALPLRRERREHDDNGVVSGRAAHKVLELVAVQLDDGPLRREVHQLRDLVGQGVLLLVRGRHQDEECQQEDRAEDEQSLHV